MMTTVGTVAATKTSAPRTKASSGAGSISAAPRPTAIPAPQRAGQFLGAGHGRSTIVRDIVNDQCPVQRRERVQARVHERGGQSQGHV